MCFEAGSHCVAPVGGELTLQTRLALKFRDLPASGSSYMLGLKLSNI